MVTSHLTMLLHDNVTVIFKKIVAYPSVSATSSLNINDLTLTLTVS